MDGRSIYGVKRVIRIENDIERVNEYLRGGFVLLLVYADDRQGEYGPGQYPIFVLGYGSEEESPPEAR